MDAIQYTDYLYKQLQRDLQRQQRQLDAFRVELSDREAEGFPEVAYANLPYAVDGMTSHAMRFVTDGLKQGETTGNGTGVICFFNPVTNTWKRVSDDTDVAI